jgi:cytosine deaminase
MAATLAAVRLGDRVVDLTVAGGRIARVEPTDAPARGLVLPLLVDAHLHLDSIHTAGRLPRRPQTPDEAIALAAADAPRRTRADIRARAGRALAQAEARGIVALRAHVAWPGPARPLAWDVLAELAEDWRGRVEVQRAALCDLDLVGDPDAGGAVADEVAATGGVLGASVRRQEHLPAKLEAVFALALRHDLALDFHVDQGLDRAARGFDTIVALTRRHRLPGQVLAGHACSLALRPEAETARLLDEAGRAGLGLCALPTAAWLGDAASGRTPRLRSLAPLQEARAGGMDVLLALDHVRDAFYPYGACDLLDTWRLAVLNARLDPAGWLDSVTTLPAKWLGRRPGPLAPGAPADFLHVAVPDVPGLVDAPCAARTVWRAGRPLAAPDN